jgi:hypothetical protein
MQDYSNFENLQFVKNTIFSKFSQNLSFYYRDLRPKKKLLQFTQRITKKKIGWNRRTHGSGSENDWVFSQIFTLTLISDHWIIELFSPANILPGKRVLKNGRNVGSYWEATMKFWILSSVASKLLSMASLRCRTPIQTGFLYRGKNVFLLFFQYIQTLRNQHSPIAGMATHHMVLTI